MSSYSNQAAESTFIWAGAANTNYGTNVRLNLGESSGVRRSLIRFPSLPAGVASVSNVILYLYSADEYLTGNATLNVYRNLRAWVEGETTWNIYKTSNNWGTAGSGNTSTDYSNSALGSASISSTIAANAEVQITLDNTLFLALLNNQATYPGCFFLKFASETADQYWRPHSNDAATSTYRPKLTFDYTASSLNFSKAGDVAVASIAKIGDVAIASVKKAGDV